MTTIRQLALIWILLAGSFVVLGCGRADTPPLGNVTGTVTLNGEPLVGVIVLFKPDKGRAATAITDGKGAYNLEYVYGVKGTKVGPSSVSFEWPLGFAGAKPLPEKYTTSSELKQAVKPGRNTFNFDLESAGTPTPKPAEVVD